MARFHAVALGRNSAHVAKVALLVAVAMLVASCGTVPWMPGGAEERFPSRSLIYLETSEFRWVNPTERKQLACANGMPLVCSAGHSRLSLFNCGCLPVL